MRNFKNVLKINQIGSRIKINFIPAKWMMYIKIISVH